MSFARLASRRRETPASAASSAAPLSSARIFDILSEALPDLVEIFLGPFAKILLKIFNPYLPHLLNVFASRFHLADPAAAAAANHYAPPRPSPARRAAKAFVAMAISYFLSRRFGVGCMGALLLLWGPSYTESMEIGRGGAMAGLREAAFWELGMAYVRLCCYYAAGGGGGGGAAAAIAVFVLAALQVIFMRDVAMDEGQEYVVNDEPLATKSALWMSLCCMCYFLPTWFAVALVIAACILVPAAVEVEATPQSAGVNDQVQKLAALIAAHKRELICNTSAGISVVTAIATKSSASLTGFLLCLPLTFSLFYATMTPERFLENAATLPLLASVAAAAAIYFVPPFVVAMAAAGVWYRLLKEGEWWRYQAEIVRGWLKTAAEMRRRRRWDGRMGGGWAANGGGWAEFWTACGLGVGGMAYTFAFWRVDWDLNTSLICILLPIFFIL